jgi:hypothetical protein
MASLWSSSSFYIIIVTNPVNLNEMAAYTRIWYLKIFKLIILFEDATNGQVRMITPDFFFRKKMTDVQIGNDLSKVFVKQIKNLHGLALNTAYFEDPNRLYEKDGKFGGFDGEYLNTILTALNASLIVNKRISKSEEILLDALVASSVIDINVNTIFQKKKTSKPKLVDNLYPNDMFEIRVLVPKAGLVSSLQLFLQPFSIKVWITTVVVFMTLGWGWHRLNRRYSRRRLTRTEIGFQLTRIQITQAFNLASIIVPLRFKKVFVIGFVIWSFVLSQAYQSVMIANLMEPFSYPEINTIEQLNRSGLVVVTPYLYSHFVTNLSPIELSNSKFNDKKFELALQHRFDPNTAYVMSNTDAYTLIYSEKNIKDGRPIMHLMEEVLAYAPQSYIINKKLPLKEEINKIMGRIRASGIDQYWKTLHFGRAEIRYKRKLAAQAAEPFLKMEQFRYAFYVLFIGQSLAIVVFIFELIWARLQRFLNTYFRLPVRH